jgi:uncharacterized protein (DUF2147 family)
MKNLYILAALLMASPAAHAGNSISLDIDGHHIHVAVPRNCSSLSCLQISGMSGSGFGFNKKHVDDDDDDNYNRKTPAQNIAPAPAPVAAPAPQTVAAQPTAPVANQVAPAVAPAATTPAPPSVANTVAPVIQAVAPVVAAVAPALSAPAPSNNATVAPAPAPVAAVAPAPVAPAPVAAAPAYDPNSPLGLWATEENKGNVRIESCGPNLCGYSEKTGEKILISMKPQGSKWSGRIHDPDSGSNYDSTIAMKGPNALKVQGCAFGGMFCGGQTWKRVS